MEQFWSSVDLTGNQTNHNNQQRKRWFWSSVDLTGNQTSPTVGGYKPVFWSSVDLTGNQTQWQEMRPEVGFGAVSI